MDDAAFKTKFRSLMDRIWETRQDPAYRDNATRILTAEAEHQKAQVQYAWGAMGIPPLYYPDLWSPKPTEALRELRFWLPEKRIVVMAGPGRTGKSFAAAVAVSEYRGLFVHAQKTAEAKFDRDIWDKWSSVRLLAIDDLGTEQKGDDGAWWDSEFFKLIDRRVGANLKTVITTNLLGPDFMARYASGDGLQRLLRRFKEHGKFLVVKEPA